MPEHKPKSKARRALVKPRSPSRATPRPGFKLFSNAIDLTLDECDDIIDLTLDDSQPTSVPAAQPTSHYVRSYRNRLGNFGLNVDMYSFRFNKFVNDDDMYWTCNRSKCRASCITSGNGPTSQWDLLSLNHHHNHNPMSDKQFVLKEMIYLVKERARDCPLLTPTDIVYEVNKKVNADLEKEILLDPKDLHNLRTAVIKYRLHIIGRLPKSRKETIEHLKTLEKSFEKDGLLVKLDEKTQIVMVCDKQNFKLLDEYAYCDGTFKCCPKHFYQMYSFQVLKNGWYLPVCHFLLPNKKESTYVTMLHMLKTESSLILKNVMLDFEVGMLNALRKVYPGIHLRGCRFHLGQSWWRQIQVYGLARVYKDKKSASSKWLKLCFSK